MFAPFKAFQLGQILVVKGQNMHWQVLHSGRHQLYPLILDLARVRRSLFVLIISDKEKKVVGY